MQLLCHITAVSYFDWLPMPQFLLKFQGGLVFYVVMLFVLCFNVVTLCESQRQL